MPSVHQEAGFFVVSAGPPLARLWRIRPTLGDERDLKPCDDDPDGVDAHYIRESTEPEIETRVERSGLPMQPTQ
jgi:hypothetical protein